MKMRLTDYSGGTAAEFNGLSFSPLYKRSTAGTYVVKSMTTYWKLAPTTGGCQWGLWRLEDEVGESGDFTGDSSGAHGVGTPFSSPSVRACLSSPRDRACRLQTSCASERAANRGIEAAIGRVATSRGGKGIRTACRPSAQSG